MKLFDPGEGVKGLRVLAGRNRPVWKWMFRRETQGFEKLLFTLQVAREEEELGTPGTQEAVGPEGPFPFGSGVSKQFFSEGRCCSKV